MSCRGDWYAIDMSNSREAQDVRKRLPVILFPTGKEEAASSTKVGEHKIACKDMIPRNSLALQAVTALSSLLSCLRSATEPHLGSVVKTENVMVKGSRSSLSCAITEHHHVHTVVIHKALEF